jgi:plastocyanin
MNRLGVLAAAASTLIVAGGLATGCGSSSSSSSSSSAATTAATTASTAAAPASTSSTTTTSSTPAAASAGAAQVIKLAADPGGALKFNTTSLTAKAGKVKIEFTNASPVPHNLTVQGSASSEGATPTSAGGTKALTLNLKAGTYSFFCSVPGHRQAGMQGTLVVN